MRRNAFVFLVLAVFVALPGLLQAQIRSVTGRVTIAETNEPLEGARVMIRGTTVGTYTDAQGNFTLRAPADARTLVITYIGFKSAEVSVTDRVDVLMERQAIALEGIVVTALGMHREKLDLGYSVQDIEGSELMKVPELNLVNSLKGTIAGVHVTDAGPTGGTSRVVIRGSSSIAGNNQPLFVVDGIPVDNAASGVEYIRNQGYGGIDYGNAVQDIDPANIESISVLKGPNAAALYGSRASNGAIVITTKSARSGRGGGLGISASTSFTMESPLRLPRYQNAYGQGVNGEFDWVDGAGAGTWDFVDESWGPKMDGRPINQFTGPAQPWVAHPDNVRSFFRTGRTWTTNAAVSQVSDRSNVRLSLTNTAVEGMAPGNTIGRVSVALKGGAQMTDRLSSEASLNYTKSEGKDRVGTGYDEDNPMQSFIWFGRQVDMEALRNYQCAGTEPTPCTKDAQYNWNYNYHNNPFWEQLVNTNADERDRLLGHVQLGYQLTNWLSATGRVGRDWYRDHRKAVTEFNSLDDAGDGGFAENTIYRAETNADFLLTATRQLTPDFTVDLSGGGNLRENNYQRADMTVTKLTAPGIYTIDNAAVTPSPTDYDEQKKTRSLYGSLSLNYKGYLNVDLTGRNDWSSTLPDGANSYFYPSVSGAFVFSDALGLESNFLSTGKLRGSWTRVGNDTDPYQLAAVFTAQQAFGQVPMFSVPNQLANADLKPEETTAWEAGADLGLFDERFGLVLTYYNRSTRNQILGVQISSTSGFTNQVLNAGEVRNSGLELLFRTVPIQSRGGFGWDMTVNWSKNNSQVRQLYGDLKTLVLGSYWSLDVEARGPETDATTGEVTYHPYGTLFGNGYLRDSQGRWMLDADGLPRIDPVRRVLGQYQPDWLGGVQNRFTYGPVDLSVLLDGQWGGSIFSTTDWFGEYSGVLESTLRGRETDWCDPGIVVDGVLPDGSVNGDGTNDVTACPMDYFHANFGNHEASIVDASYLKLRELRLAYQLPSGFMERLGFSGGEIALIGRNLALWSKTNNIDPETAFDASNVQGIEFGQIPTARSIGMSLSIRP